VPNDLMLRCEQRRDYKVNDGYERRWKEVPVSEAVGAQPSDIRCMHCHGAVRIHQRQVEHGPRDHVEHRLRQDSESCRAGIYFRGEHKMSTQPVV
jgi:hypothetical protein